MDSSINLNFKQPHICQAFKSFPKAVKLASVVPAQGEKVSTNDRLTLIDSYWSDINHNVLNSTTRTLGLTYGIYGIGKRSSESEVVNIGRNRVIMEQPYNYHVCNEWGNTKFTMMPAISAAASDIVDRNVIAAGDSLSVMFPTGATGGKVVLCQAARQVIATLTHSEINNVRFAWRLAQLWWMKALAEYFSTNAFSVATLDPRGKMILANDAGQWNTLLSKSGHNFACMNTNGLILGVDDIASLFMLAAEPDMQLRFANQVPTPGILQSSPQIADLKVLICTDTLLANSSNYTNMSAATVWNIILQWIDQAFNLEEFMELVTNIGALIFSHDKDLAAPLYIAHASIGLPVALMQANVLQPISMKSKSFGETIVEIEQPKVEKILVKATMTSIFIGLAARQAMLSYGMNWNYYRNNHSSATHRLVYFTCNMGICPIYHAAQHIMEALLGNVKIGKILGRIRYKMDQDIFNNWYDSINALQWEEILPILTKVPSNCFIMGSLNPVKLESVQSVNTNIYYTSRVLSSSRDDYEALSSLSKWTNIDFGLEVSVPSYKTYRVYPCNWASTYRGGATYSDWTFNHSMAIDDMVLTPVFRFTNILSIANAFIGDERLSWFDWYLTCDVNMPSSSFDLSRVFSPPTLIDGKTRPPPSNRTPPTIDGPHPPSGPGNNIQPPPPPPPPSQKPKGSDDLDDNVFNFPQQPDQLPIVKPIIPQALATKTYSEVVRQPAPRDNAGEKIQQPSKLLVITKDTKGKIVKEEIRNNDQQVKIPSPAKSGFDARMDKLMKISETNEASKKIIPLIEMVKKDITKPYSAGEDVSVVAQRSWQTAIGDMKWYDYLCGISLGNRASVAKEVASLLGVMTEHTRIPSLQRQFSQEKSRMEVRASALAVTPVLKPQELLVLAKSTAIVDPGIASSSSRTTLVDTISEKDQQAVYTALLNQYNLAGMGALELISDQEGKLRSLAVKNSNKKIKSQDKRAFKRLIDQQAKDALDKEKMEVVESVIAAVQDKQLKLDKDGIANTLELLAVTSIEQLPTGAMKRLQEAIDVYGLKDKPVDIIESNKSHTTTTKTEDIGNKINITPINEKSKDIVIDQDANKMIVTKTGVIVENIVDDVSIASEKRGLQITRPSQSNTSTHEIPEKDMLLIKEPPTATLIEVQGMGGKPKDFGNSGSLHSSSTVDAPEGGLEEQVLTTTVAAPVLTFTEISTGNVENVLPK